MPRFVFFFNTRLIIPAVPSGSYLADGFVTTSMLSIELAGICVRTSELLMPASPDGLPSIKKVTFVFPRKATVPSAQQLRMEHFA